MSRWIAAFAAVLLLAGLAPVVWANGGPPPFPRGNVPVLGEIPANLVVEVDEKAKEVRLQIPQGLFQPKPQPKPERKGADAGLRMEDLLAGLALTGCLVSGGLWMIRRGRNRFLGPVSLALAALTLTGFAVWANSPAPRPLAEKKPLPVALPVSVKLNGKIVLEIVPLGGPVKLIVPKEMAEPEAKTPEK